MTWRHLSDATGTMEEPSVQEEGPQILSGEFSSPNRDRSAVAAPLFTCRETLLLRSTAKSESPQEVWQKRRKTFPSGQTSASEQREQNA